MTVLLAGCGEKIYSVEELTADPDLAGRIEKECRSPEKRGTRAKDQNCVNSIDVVEHWPLQKKVEFFRQ